VLKYKELLIRRAQQQWCIGPWLETMYGKEKFLAFSNEAKHIMDPQGISFHSHRRWVGYSHIQGTF